MKSLSLCVYNLSGKAVKTVELDATVFGVEPNVTLIHQAVTSYLANKRAPFAHTKDRGQVAGGGKKPWRQKGTGNARVGSTRSPLWRGGGITFGPNSDRNYSVRMPQKMRQAALKMALSTKVKDSQMIVIDSVESLDGKTKSWVKAFATLPGKQVKTLVVSNAKSDLAERSIRNTETNKYVSLEGMTTYDLIRFPQLVITLDALQAISERFGASVKEVAAKTKEVKA